MTADLTSPEAVPIDGEVVHPSGASAIASGGGLVIYADVGGPHDYVLWATTRLGDDWRAPLLLTADSPYPFHGEPAIGADGGRVVFNCGNHQYAVDISAICEVATDGTGVRVVLAPADGPPGSATTGALRHATYAPDDEILFAADWTGPAIWRILPGATAPEHVGPAFDVDTSPCVLPDGRIASLWQGRPANAERSHELKIMTADAASYVVVAGEDIEDITCGG